MAEVQVDVLTIVVGALGVSLFAFNENQHTPRRVVYGYSLAVGLTILVWRVLAVEPLWMAPVMALAGTLMTLGINLAYQRYLRGK